MCLTVCIIESPFTSREAEHKPDSIIQLAFGHFPDKLAVKANDPRPCSLRKKLLIEPGLPWVLHSTEILVRSSALSEGLAHTPGGVTGSGHIINLIEFKVWGVMNCCNDRANCDHFVR